MPLISCGRARNTADVDRIECLQAQADQIMALGSDWIFCIGVLQFIAEPGPRSRLLEKPSDLVADFFSLCISGNTTKPAFDSLHPSSY